MDRLCLCLNSGSIMEEASPLSFGKPAVAVSFLSSEEELPLDPNLWNFDSLIYTVSRSVMSDSSRPHGQYPTRLLCPWNFLGKNMGVGCHFLLQGIFLTQGLNPSLLHWQAESLPLSHQGSLMQIMPVYKKKVWHSFLHMPGWSKGILWIVYQESTGKL